MNASAPPLEVWLYALAIVVAIALAGPAFAPAEESAAETMNLSRLEESPTAGRRVVALGSSKLLYAVSFDAALAQRLDSPTRHASFVRVTRLGAEAADVEPALPAISAHPPDLLLFDAELLTFDRTEPSPARRALARFRSRIRRALPGVSADSAVLHLNHRQNRGGETVGELAECMPTVSADRRAHYAERVASRHLSDPRVAAVYIEWLRRIAASGTRVVLLPVPRAPWAESVFPAPLREASDAYLREVALREGFALWQSPVIPDSGFCDEAHMAAAGRQAYEQWLVPKLSDALATQP